MRASIAKVGVLQMLTDKPYEGVPAREAAQRSRSLHWSLRNPVPTEMAGAIMYAVGAIFVELDDRKNEIFGLIQRIENLILRHCDVSWRLSDL